MCRHVPKGPNGSYVPALDSLLKTTKTSPGSKQNHNVNYILSFKRENK